ncbi:hypothetical protein BVH03_08540 [Pseudomonas sp. PA15(2017)]|uniref:hypothetical protein n=1 Tax=Pseudomonas sp. PA15(2017) TaxID=1932111 RepID=UPI00096350E2|nr:hypothetical protein [Pseudomonas sp. PA15(2017)]OLU31509.1 hypothetical protein BVH03_08540 [Pseudomonas sp. PA15(2017)]
MPAKNPSHLAQLIANDGHAASFQSLGQYRSALLKEISQASAAPEQDAVAWAICHRPGKVDELSATYANRRAAQAHVDGYRGDGSPELHITDLYTHPSAEIEQLRAENSRLRDALKFYADSEHYHFESDNWDSVSGEPSNILWHSEDPDFVEDGEVARAALSAQPSEDQSGE